MLYKDKILVCSKCGTEFALTSREQEFFIRKGFKFQPRRCKSCRRQKRVDGEGNQSVFTFGNIEKSVPPSDR